MSYFRKIKNEAGEEVFEEVDLSKEELPEAVVKAQKPFQEVLTETIKRRKRIDVLEAAIADATKLEGEEEVDPAKSPVKPETPVVPPPVDPDALFTEFEKRLEAKKKAELEAADKEKSEIADIIKKFGLRSGAVEILAEAKNPAAMAEKLAKSAYRFDEQSSGDPDKKQLDSAIGGALKKLGLQDPV